jgi:hypothetical protein
MEEATHIDLIVEEELKLGKVPFSWLPERSLFAKLRMGEVERGQSYRSRSLFSEP